MSADYECGADVIDIEMGVLNAHILLRSIQSGDFAGRIRREDVSEGATGCCGAGAFGEDGAGFGEECAPGDDGDDGGGDDDAFCGGGMEVRGFDEVQGSAKGGLD